MVEKVRWPKNVDDSVHIDSEAVHVPVYEYSMSRCIKKTRTNHMNG